MLRVDSLVSFLERMNWPLNVVKLLWIPGTQVKLQKLENGLFPSGGPIHIVLFVISMFSFFYLTHICYSEYLKYIYIYILL